MAGRAAPLRSSGAGGRQLVVLILLLLILFLFTAPIVMVFGEDPSVNGKCNIRWRIACPPPVPLS
ncbi:hypothetical protein DAI22_12g071700 [Oryza sativa Japonica Group]|nr:hypothetical protein DAI22_12g071700 [Oryza sativa Japonica Group]